MLVVIPMKPVPKERARVVIHGGRARSFTPEKTAIAQAEISARVMEFKGEFPKGVPLRLVATFYMPRPKRTRARCPVNRPDLSNLEKLVEDAMNGIVYPDDSQIVEKHTRKVWADGDPRLYILVTECKE